MLRTSVDGIAVSCATTGVWPVAVATPDRAIRTKPWLSAEEAMQAMDAPAAHAEARAQEVLKANPDDPRAGLLLAAALIRENRWSNAQEILERLCQTQPQMEFAWRGLGQVLARSDENTRAIAAFERALDLEIHGKEAWFALGSLLSFHGDEKGRRSSDSDTFAEIERALANDRLDIGESLSHALLMSRPNDPDALKLRADVMIRKSRWPEAKLLLERSLTIAPKYVSARFRFATMLFAHGEFAASALQFDALLRSGCDTPLLRGAKAVALARDGHYSRAIEAFDSFIGNCDSRPGLWYEYARVLRWAGDRRTSAAFRKATEILPCYFSAWYALATVKSFRWNETLVGQIRAQVARPDLAIEDRTLMHFALGKALEDLGRYAEAFENFRASKAVLREIAEYSPKPSQAAWRSTRLLFNPAFLRRRAGAGSRAKDTIFIVGMPRAGSTLVEQILSAHSQIEGLGELTALPTLVEGLYTRVGGPQHWPLLLQRLSPEDFRALGEEYMQMARGLRKTDAPFFTDKQPNNFQLTGLIHLMLPNAKIVDVRRHPLGCGFSCFKHYFPKGHRFACDLGDIGQRYADYVRLMAHFDEVLPGKAHRLIYERLIENFETEVRRLLEHLGLPFEPQCLRFFENRRTVITLSYEQVFMPLYDSGVGQWWHYEPWLAPLKAALGCVLEVYPDVPTFFPDVHATSRAPRPLGEAGGWFRTVKGLGQRPFSSGSEVAVSGCA
jgi:tetratricopeptide (TPR) repeat protein